MALLRHRDFSNALFNNAADEDGFMGMWGARRNRQPKDPNRFPKVPSGEGTQLMRSGAFGANDYDLHAKKRISRRMLERELGLGDREQRKRNNDIVAQVSSGPPTHPGFPHAGVTFLPQSMIPSDEGREDHPLRRPGLLGPVFR